MEGIGVNSAAFNGTTALMQACGGGHEELVELLLRHRADTSCVNENQWNALHSATQQGHAGVVAHLLSAGARLDPKDRSGWTALTLACAFNGPGFAGCARLLLEHGADIDALNEHEETALQRACNSGNLECVRMCLAHGAAINHRCRDRRTPLIDAAERGHLAICKLLSSHGADRKPVDRWEKDAIGTARQFQRFEVAGWLERTSLWTTALHHLEVLTPERTATLLEGGADVHARAAPGAPSPLDLASSLQGDGSAAGKDGAAAAIVLAWWRARMYALAMGTHARLGEHSPLLKLGGKPELLHLIVRLASL